MVSRQKTLYENPALPQGLYENLALPEGLYENLALPEGLYDPLTVHPLSDIQSPIYSVNTMTTV